MVTAKTQWILLASSGALSLAAAVFYRALRSASPARLEELNDQYALYRQLPDIDDALVVMGWLKVIVYAGFISSVGLLFFANRGVHVPSYFLVSAVSAGALLGCEALALMAVGHHSGRVLYRMLPAVAVLSRGAKAVLAAGTAFWAIIARLSGGEAPPAPQEAAEEEILDAVSEGEREGVIRNQEREMIESIIEFKDVEVAEIMTPRTELDTVSAGMTLRETLLKAAGGGHSRLPVFAENADNIVGVLHVKDVLQYLNSDMPFSAPVRDLMRPPHFVPETKRVRELLQEFRATNVHMAIVLDEYGGTSGIVTIEDILEEIVGEIEDEYDTHEPPPVRVSGPGRATVEGQANVGEVNDALALAFDEEADYETIAGYVLFHTGRIPKSGETFDLEGVRFRILEADERRIKRMSLEVLKGQGGETAEGQG